MKWELVESKKHIVIAHVAIILAVLGASEPFDDGDFSPWVMLIALGALLICYFIFRARKVEYIPKLHIFIAFGTVLLWIAALFTCEYWTNINGWDRLVYLFYPFISGIFLVCLLVMNLGVFIVKKKNLQMNKSIKSALGIGFFFGCICYVVCLFFFGDGLISALMGLLAGMLYFVIFYMLGQRSAKKQAQILSQFGSDFLFSENVNDYGETGITNGILFLTEQELCFASTDKKQYKLDYPTSQIGGIKYGMVSKYISGLILLMQDGTTGKFGMTEKEFAHLKEKLDTIKCT